ncbi:helix-turn-helix transcriptional regulator [Neisseriaceae bacterium JH1-16]|nr:helix-turn-helix transcriptional regulator [Neisseriaceae bacterium JH1-16]
MPPTGQSVADGLVIPTWDALPAPLYFRAHAIPAGVTVPLHRHPWAQLLYACRGLMQVDTESARYLLSPEQALWIPPGTAHGVSVEHEVWCRSLYLDATLPLPFGQRCEALTVTPLLRELIAAGSALAAEDSDPAEVDRLVAVLLDRLPRLQAARLVLPLPSDPRLRRLADALLAEPGDERRMEDWARQVGASERTLARRFRAETGLGFRAWRQQLRLLAALPRLQAGEAVTRVAADSGYASTSAFIEAFQRQFGCTPGRVGMA